MAQKTSIVQRPSSRVWTAEKEQKRLTSRLMWRPYLAWMNDLTAGMNECGQEREHFGSLFVFLDTSLETVVGILVIEFAVATAELVNEDLINH